jgi:DNA-binding NarL/FixJ family response regulator
LTPRDRPRVVLADDHPLILEAALGVLTPSFDVVAAVGSGADAIAATTRLDPDIVVLDIAMPGLDGFQTASAIAARGPRPRIAFMSAHLEDEYILKGLNRGASAFVAKPRMRQDLVPALEYAIAGHTCIPSAGVLPRWHRAAGHCHDLQLYGADRALAAAVADFFAAALEAEHSIVAIATPAHLGELRTTLAARDVDVAGLIESGRYSPVDVTTAIDSVVIDGKADEARYIATLDEMVQIASRAGGGSRHVSVFGEIAPVLCGRGLEAPALAIERMSIAYAASHPISVLCGYSAAVLGASADLAAEVYGAHEAVLTADFHGYASSKT